MTIHFVSWISRALALTIRRVQICVAPQQQLGHGEVTQLRRPVEGGATSVGFGETEESSRWVEVDFFGL